MQTNHAREIRERFTDPKSVIAKLGLQDGMRPSGNGVDIRCPSHDDTDPSCSVFMGADHTLGWNCHACAAKGDVLDLVAAVQKLDTKRDFPRVLDEAAQIFGYDLSNSTAANQEKPAPKAKPKPKVDVAALWEALGPVDDATLAFLKSRGLEDAARIVRTAAPTSPGEAGRLAAQGFRLAAPLRDAGGHVVAVQLRKLDESKDRFRSIGPVSDGVFGNPLVLDQVQAVTVAEGMTDYLMAHIASSSGAATVFGIAGVNNTGALEKMRVRGKQVVLATDADTPGDKCAADLAPVLAANGADVWRMRPTLGKDLCAHVAAGGKVADLAEKMQHIAKPVADAVVRCAADIKITAVRWLWKNRIPFGAMTILDGDPGLGKSTVLGDFHARNTRGDAFPGDLSRRAPSFSIVISYEDSEAATLVPRLHAAGADLKRVFLWNLDDCVFKMPDDLERLERVIVERGATLVTIDPLMAALSGEINSHRDQDVRQVLSALGKIAERTGAAIVLARHLNKSGGATALYRGGGSIGIVGAARAALVMARDPDDDDARILSPTKNNLGREQPSMRLRLVEAPSPAAGVSVAHVKWEGETQHSANELMMPTEDKSAADEAVEFLRMILADGPVSAKKIIAEGRAVDISERSIRRAKSRLNVKSEPETLPGSGKTKGWFWTLPDGQVAK